MQLLIPFIISVVVLGGIATLLVRCRLARRRDPSIPADLAQSQVYQVGLYRFLRRITEVFSAPLATQMSALSFLSREHTLHTVDFERLHELAKTAYEQNIAMQQMIQRARRIDPFASGLEMAEIRVAPFVVQTTRSRFALLGERGQIDPTEIQLTVAGDLPEDSIVTTYREILGDVLTELFDNALIHAADGGQVDVSYGARSGADGEWYLITVRDYGRGLPAESRERLFDPLSDSAAGGASLAIGLHVVSVAVVATLRAHLIYRDATPGAAFTLEIPRELPRDGSGWVDYRGR